ncbi:crossover junction endodeoxyribonuclease RuvC [Patescibacteria group bacterium]|nr:crossover junction endodeoxyribonuclease RuvC [Patescibacteria group bacterium]
MPISKIILGIDPGTAATGFGVIHQLGSKIAYIASGVIQTKSQQPMEQRLIIINRQLAKIIKKHQPKVAAVEQLFFCRNVKTALAVGQARGVILMTCAQAKLDLVEFTPLQIKQSITGYGQASKKQVQLMVKQRLSLKTLPKPDDLADALAIAICCSQTNNWK